MKASICDLYAARGITPGHKEAADAIRCISEGHIAQRGRQQAALAAAQQAADRTEAAQKASEDTEAAISAQECIEHVQLL